MRKSARFLAVGFLWLGLLVSASGQASWGAAQPNGTLTVKIENPQQSEKPSWIRTLDAVSPLVAALAWPTVFIVLLITQRVGLRRLLESAVDVVRLSTRIKLGDMIDLEVDRSAKDAEEKPTPTREASPEEVEAAARVSGMVTWHDIAIVRSRMLEFAREYEATRSSMASGSQRTRAMNAIVAKMRTIALASQPFLKEFAASSSPGIRLAAITILELTPNLEYLDWLGARMGTEQPFLLFHAGVALLSAVRAFGRQSRERLRVAITTALQTVKSFKGGPPDANTVEVLETALSELG